MEIRQLNFWSPFFAGRSIPIERRHTDGVHLRQTQYETQRNGWMVQFGFEFIGTGRDCPLGRCERNDARRTIGPMARSSGFLISIARTLTPAI